MTLEKIKETCIEHHTATIKGYISRKIPYRINEYEGIFGKDTQWKRHHILVQNFIVLHITF